MHSNAALPLLAIALSCAGAQALSVSAACAQVKAGEEATTDVYLEVRCSSEADCGPAPESVSIEFIGMDVGAFPVASVAWIDAKGRASLEAPSSKAWPRRMVWAAPQGFAVDTRRALLSFENTPLTPEFELRRNDCRRLNAAALALLNNRRKEQP